MITMEKIKNKLKHKPQCDRWTRLAQFNESRIERDNEEARIQELERISARERIIANYGENHCPGCGCEYNSPAEADRCYNSDCTGF